MTNFLINIIKVLMGIVISASYWDDGVRKFTAASSNFNFHTLLVILITHLFRAPFSPSLL